MKPQLLPIYRNLRYRTLLNSSWSPSALFASSEVGVWYDPSDLSTMFQDAAGTTAAVVGQPVGKILDKSGNGNHATQSTDLSRPVLRQSGDKYYLEFDGIDDFLVTSAIDFSATDKMSVFVGITKDTDAAASSAIELSSNAGNLNGAFAIRAPYTNAAEQYCFILNGSQSTRPVIDGYAAPITNILAVNFDISNADMATEIVVKINATPVTLSGAGNTSAGTGNFGNNYPLYLGALGGTSQFLNGNLYSIIVRGALSDVTQITNAEAYVNGKTGAYND